MAVNMSYSSQPDLEPYSHFTYQASSQLDFTFYSPPHEGGSKDDPVPAAVFNADLPGGNPSLGLTGDTNMDSLLNLEETTPKKRDRGERIVWTPEEDEYLRAAVQLYGDKTEKWAKIAACVPGRTNKNCRKRWFHSLDPKLKKGPWTEEEDRLLMSGVQMYRGQWSRIAERIPGRTDDQCAKRWREGLDPLIDRAAWTPDDDLILSQRFEEFGSQWQKIALAFPGRPGLHCRNRWRKIQRSLNHMKRKRRSLGNSNDQATASGMRRQDAILDSGNDDFDIDLINTTDDISLLRDAYLDEDFALENVLVMDENGLNEMDDAQDDQSDSEDEKPYGCAVPDCSFVTSSPSLLYYHFKATHAGVVIEKPFKCTYPGCETRKRYKNINGLQYHITHAKNTQGHSGNSANLYTGDDIPESSKSARVIQKNASIGLSNASASKPSSPTRDISLLIPSSNYNPASMMLSNPPTPADIQLQIHQSTRDHTSQLTIPQLTRNAFSLPHSPSSLEASVTSSRTSSGSSSPQIQRTIFRCPELGCGQSYHQVSGLNMHMTTNHGHGSMSMGNNDTVYGADALMSQENHLSFDIDMTDLTSGTNSPLDANILLLNESILRHHMESMGHIGINPSPTTTTSQEINFDSNSNKTSFDALSGEGFIFANHTSDQLHNTINLGNPIGMIAHHPNYLQPTSMPLTLNSVSGNISPTNSGSISSTPSTPPIVPIKSSKCQESRQIAKRFTCSVPNCQKSYASMGKLNTHIRNDHPNQININSSKESDQPQDGDEQMIERPYKCLVPGCGKDYTNINGLKDHLLDAHGSTPRSNS